MILSKIEQLPIREADEKTEQQLERLVDYLLWLKKQQAPSYPTLRAQQMADYFELVVYGCVFELYFGERVRAVGRGVLTHLGQLPPLAARCEAATVEAVFERLASGEHPLRAALDGLGEVEEVRVIWEGTRGKKSDVPGTRKNDGLR